MKKQYQLTLLSLFFLVGNSCLLFGQDNRTEPPILFLFLEVEKSTNDGPIFRLDKVMASKGKLKKKRSNTSRTIPESPKKGMLRCSFFTDEDKLLHQVDIENPLLEKIEYVNEDNQYEWAKIPHDKKDFMIRTQGAEGMTYLTIEWVDEQKKMHNSERILIQNH